MKSRLLPPSEWHRLAEASGLPQIAPTLRPEDVQVVVVEDGKRIVSSMVVMRVVHFESLWIDPEFRGSLGAARKLIRTAILAARSWAKGWVWSASDTDHMDDIIKRVGGKPLPVRSYILKIQE